MKPKCKLIGEDGNIYYIMGKVVATLKKEGLQEQAEEYKQRVFSSKSYDTALQITMEYVEVE